MTVDTAADFAVLLRHSRLLEPAQLDELVGSLQVRFPQPRALAGELLRRGWLTAFQINQVFKGCGGDLLLGSYILLERLGMGGMGEVYKARNWKLGKVVAIKLIRPERLDNLDAVRRFQREVRAAAQLNHANVVHAYDCDEAGGKHFLVMEYVEGLDLARVVKKRGPLPVAQACDCIRQAALGLQHAFERGLVHRDIKPHNLLWMGSDGEPSLHDGVPTRGASRPPAATIKILDMGLARLNQVGEEGESTSTMTEEGVVMGTLDYLAPEQALDAHAADTRADLYSLGCTFYFLLTGQVPFPGGSAAEKLLKHQSRQPTPVEQLRPDTPPVVALVLRQLMAKRPEERFQTPAELAAVLSDLEAGLPVDLPPPASAPVGEETVDTSPGWSSLIAPEDRGDIVSPSEQRCAAKQRRGLSFAIMAGVALLALAVGVTFLLRGSPAPTSTPQPAVVEQEPHKEKPPATVEEWMRQVAELPIEQQVKEVADKLKRRNPGFDGAVHSTIQDGVLVGMSFESEQVADLMPLRALPQLRSLVCAGSPGHRTKLKDLSPLKGMKLTVLNCNFTEVDDLSPLEGMPLIHLQCAAVQITDLAPLRGMNLTVLNVNQNAGLKDISPLQGMPLTTFLCRGTRVFDLSPLKDSPLTILSCPLPALKDRATLHALKFLRQINRKPIAQFWKEAEASAPPPK